MHADDQIRVTFMCTCHIYVSRTSTLSVPNEYPLGVVSVVAAACPTDSVAGSGVAVPPVDLTYTV